jgi:hypothetical protein
MRIILYILGILLFGLSSLASYGLPAFASNEKDDQTNAFGSQVILTTYQDDAYEEQIWDRSQRINTVDSYQNYIQCVSKGNCQGKYLRPARRNIRRITAESNEKLNQLNNALQAVGDRLALKCEAYFDYIRKTDRNKEWHPHRTEAIAFLVQNACDIPLFVVHAESMSPGIVKLKIFNNQISTPDELKLFFVREDNPVPSKNYKISSSRKISEGKFELIIDHVQDGENTVYVTDSQKKRASTIFQVFNTPSSVVLDADQIRISGVSPPYYLQALSMDSIPIGQKIRLTNESRPNQRLFNIPEINNEEVAFLVITAGNQAIGSIPFQLEIKAHPLLGNNALFIAGFLVLFTTLIFIFRSRNVQQRRPGSNVVSPIVPSQGESSSSVRSVKNQIIEEELLAIDLSNQWKDSLVSEVVLSKKFAKKLNDLIVEEFKLANFGKIEGCLLGTSGVQLDLSYYLILEDFFPFNHKHDRNFQPPFVNAQKFIDEHAPNLQIVGYFSSIKRFPLQISQRQENLLKLCLKDNHQIVLIMNPLSLHMDMAFFTRKWNNDWNQNNANDRGNTTFAGWLDIENWLQS